MKKAGKRALLWLLILAMFCFTGCNAPDSTVLGENGVQPITVISFNVRREYEEDQGVRSWQQRKQPLVEYLNQLSPDIFCLQEISKNILQDITQGLSHSYDYKYFNGNLVLYRRDILKPELTGAFYLNSDPTRAQVGWDGKNVRNCQYFLFSHIESGARFYLFNTHFDAFGNTARYESGILLDRLFQECEYPFLLCGDLNCQEYTAAYHQLTRHMINCQAKAPQTDSGITFHDWGRRADDSSTPIDFCLASDFGVEPISFSILRDRWNGENFYSDHYPVQCSVNILY